MCDKYRIRLYKVLFIHIYSGGHLITCFEHMVTWGNSDNEM